METHLISMARALVYLAEGFALLWLAKFLYARFYRRTDMRRELFERNNSALAVAACGYLFAICIALGGALSGPSLGWRADLTGIALYGLATIALMLVAGFICEKALLPHFDNTREIVEDHNLGTAFVEAGMHIANGLIALAIIQGSGPWWSGLAFWALAQLVLLLAGRLYEVVTPHRLHRQLERDNAAVGLAFAGVLVGLGNIISVAVAGDFAGWRDSLTTFAADATFGLVVLLLIKKLTDAVLAPGVKLADEQVEERPNIGAGLIEAFGYMGGSMLVVWVL